MSKIAIIVSSFLLFYVSSNAQQSKYTNAQNLYFIQTGQFKNTSDKEVVKLTDLLKQLSKKYNEPEYDIADWTQKTQSLLKNDGINETMFFLMDEINKTKRPPNTKYKDMLGLFSYMLEKSKK